MNFIFKRSSYYKKMYIISFVVLSLFLLLTGCGDRGWLGKSANWDVRVEPNGKYTIRYRGSEAELDKISYHFNTGTVNVSGSVQEKMSPPFGFNGTISGEIQEPFKLDISWNDREEHMTLNK
jgi:hypothetical protein